MIIPLLLLMGISCFSGQVLFVREFLIIFNGNELTIGLILANWLLLEAMGCFAFGHISAKIRSPVTSYTLLATVIGLLFPVSIFAARISKTLLNVSSGQGLGIAPIFFLSLLIMFPLGFLLGGQFPLACRIYEDVKQKSTAVATGKSYFLEAIGFGVGGIIVTYLLIPYLNAMRIAFIIGCLNISCAWMLFSLNLKKRLRFCGLIFFIILGIWGYSHKINFLHDLSLKWQWKGFHLVDYQNSVYGNIAVTKQQEQYTFYYDGLSFMTIPTPNLVFTQDLVNFPLGLTDSHYNILVIGSGLGGIIKNISKFPITSIDYAEIDPLVIEMAKRYKTTLTMQELNDIRLKIHNIDARLFLKNTKKTFDIIIMNLPTPSTLQLNRFFTCEFFYLASNRLTKEGLLCLSLPASLSYLSDEQADLNKCILKTLRSVFPTTEVIVGYYNIFIASNDPLFKLSPSIIDTNLRKNKIDSPLFTNFYIKDRLRSDNNTWFYNSIRKRHVRLNKDLEPVGVFYSLGLWNALFTPGFQKIFKVARKLNLTIFIGIILTFLGLFSSIIYLSRGKRPLLTFRSFIPLLVAFSGFSGVSLNLILLLSLQTFYGYVYLHIGLLISGFMIGLTLGSFQITKHLSDIHKKFQTLLKIDGVFVVFCLIFPCFLFEIKFLVAKNIFFPLILAILTLLSITTGFLVGLEFPLANKIYLEKIPGGKKPYNILYAVDMLGSFLGAILVSIILIPILGIIHTVVLVFFLKLSLFILQTTIFFSSAQKHP